MGMNGLVRLGAYRFAQAASSTSTAPDSRAIGRRLRGEDRAVEFRLERIDGTDRPQAVPADRDRLGHGGTFLRTHSKRSPGVIIRWSLGSPAGAATTTSNSAART